MKAVVTNSNVTGYLELCEAVNPVANSDEAVISVKTFLPSERSPPRRSGAGWHTNFRLFYKLNR